MEKVESINNIEEQQVNIFSQPTHTINPIVYFFMNLGGSIWKFVRWFVGLLFSMVVALVNFFKNVGVGFWSFILGVVNFFKRKVHQFKYNDKDGRISYGIFGYSALKNKQTTFGIMYIVFEVAYIALFAIFGFKCISMLTTLGTQLPYEDPDADFSELIMGDNSIMILIYGLLWILSLVVFVYIWNCSINSGYYNYRAKNLLKFGALYEKNIEFGNSIDAGVKTAYKNKVSLSEHKKSEIDKIEAYLSKIEDEKERDYTRYLITNSYSHTYKFLRKVQKQEKKIAQTKKWKGLLLNKRNGQLQKLLARNEAKLSKCTNKEVCVEKNNISVEIFNNRTESLVSNFTKKLEAQEHKLYELNKCYAPYIEMQLTHNNSKYGKQNYYYKHVAELENEITFYTNFHKFVDIYNDGLTKYEQKNIENANTAVELLDLMNTKQANTKEKFDEIRTQKQELNAQISQIQLNYKKEVAEIKKSGAANSQELLLEAKAKLVDQTTAIMRRLNDLPTDKNIKALEKEELKESKRAYIRDKKYLKTDYTDKELGFEEVVNEMVVTYKFDYALAVSFAKSMFVKESSGEVRMLNPNEIAAKLASLKEEKDKFIVANPTKYVVKLKTFKESVKSLFNEKFNVTILLLPIVGIVLFSIIPLIFSIFIAFTNYSKDHEPPTQLFTWIGLGNFITLINPNPNSQFAQLPTMLGKTIGWTLIWAIIATFSNYILGIIVALMINKDGIKFKKLWRTVFVMTIAIPQFISLLSIGTLLKDSGAIGNWYAQTFGTRLGFGTDASADAVLIAKIVIICVNIWVGIPYTILSTTGILLNIPKDLYESAKVDGAGTITQFTKITMPYILFVTGPYLITQFIGNINNFNVIFFLTGGGPAYSGVGLLGLGQTDLLITFIYKIVTSTSNPQYGIASAIGIVVFIICSFISIVMYNKSGSIKEEDQFQ